MCNHISKNMKDFLKKLVHYGFVVEYNGKCVKILPPATLKVSMYIAHFSDKGYHPVRRYVKNVCNINIE